MTAEAPTRPATKLPLYALMGANLISFVGSQLTTLAIPWFVLVTTGSATRMALAAVASLAPIVLAAMVGGPAVDRVGFQRASVLADLISGLTIALVPLLHETVGLGFGALLLLVFLSALFDAPGATARAAIVPEIAAAGDLPLERANGLHQVIGAFASLVGPPLAGVLIVVLGASNVLWVDAATFLISAALVALVVPTPRRAAVAALEDNYLGEALAGWRFLRDQPLIRGIVLTGAVTNLLLTPAAVVILPYYARDRFGNADRAGLMLGAFGAGAVLGAVAFTLRGERFPRRPLLLAGFLVACIPLLVLAVSPPLAVILATLFVAGVVAGPIQPLVATVKQERIPAAMRGRVLGAGTAVTLVAAPAGTLLAGAGIDAFGLTAVLAATAGGFLALAVWVARNSALHDLAPPRAHP